MADTWVVNASPLISLANIDRTDILTELGCEVLVPPAVVAEFQRGGEDMIPEGIRILDPVALVPSVLMWGLGKGETEVLSFALGSKPDIVAILDDMAARRCALAHGVAIRGTIGLVVLAKLQGLVPSVKPVFDDLQQAGLYVAPQVIAAALHAAGELPLP